MTDQPNSPASVGEAQRVARTIVSKPVLAWHFVGKTLRDGRPVPADGEVLRHEGPVEMCRRGLHASRRIIDALNYAPGNTICRVEMRDVVDEDKDKLVARERVILWRVDGEVLLRQFARDCALEVLHLWATDDTPGIDDVVWRLLTGDPAARSAAGDHLGAMVIAAHEQEAA